MSRDPQRTARYTDGSPVGDGPFGDDGLYDWERRMMAQPSRRTWWQFLWRKVRGR